MSAEQQRFVASCGAGTEALAAEECREVFGRHITGLEVFKGKFVFGLADVSGELLSLLSTLRIPERIFVCVACLPSLELDRYKGSGA